MNINDHRFLEMIKEELSTNEGAMFDADVVARLVDMYDSKGTTEELSGPGIDLTVMLSDREISNLMHETDTLINHYRDCNTVVTTITTDIDTYHITLVNPDKVSVHKNEDGAINVIGYVDNMSECNPRELLNSLSCIIYDDAKFTCMEMYVVAL